MFSHTRIYLVITALLSSMLTASAQEISQVDRANKSSIRLVVMVAPRAGPQVNNLEKQDFTLVDNKSPRPITSFKEINARQEPVKVILLIDAVNSGFDRVAYVREQVKKFLQTDGGHLAHPTTIAILTDKGTQIQKDFTNDGNALSSSLDHNTIGLRQITRNSGIWGADERFQISLTAVRQLSAYAATIPGRKIVLWVSPGWPLLSGENIQLSSKQQQQIFGNVVSFSKQLQQANITLYNINPLGPDENLFSADYYQNFLKGVSNPGQTDLADLSLQVLAIQSGGLVLNGSSDVAGGLKRFMADTESWYEIAFETPIAERPNEYHQIEITVDKPGLIARTRDGYYAQP
jgi:VWFA-related protein